MLLLTCLSRDLFVKRLKSLGSQVLISRAGFSKGFWFHILTITSHSKFGAISAWLQLLLCHECNGHPITQDVLITFI